MKKAPYKLAGDIPEVLLGTKSVVDGKTVLTPFTIDTQEAETLDEFRTQVENGEDKHILRLAQGAKDIITQRKVREFLSTDEVAAALAGKEVKWSESETVDYGAHSEEERIEDILVRAQEVADSFVYGSRTVTVGVGKATKAAAADMAKAKEAAKADPELAAKLAALGITL